ncbi:MAG TPA: hypothetical protein VGO93_20415 [Candidatus Xenobia bacterium]|jgi:hypothetical protein
MHASSLSASHRTRHAAPARAQAPCPDEAGEPTFDPKGPGGSGYPTRPRAPYNPDDGDYTGKGPGGSGYPSLTPPAGGYLDLIC